MQTSKPVALRPARTTRGLHHRPVGARPWAMALLLLLLGVLTAAPAQAQHACGSRTLGGQTDINLFDCSVVFGDLVIDDQTYSITNLVPLAPLQQITGNLIIRGNPKLTSLTGLEQLTSIGGSLQIRYNNNLTSLTGLQGISSVGGELVIEDNDGLTSMTGLEGLSSLGDGATISWNKNLTSLTGLEGLSSVGGGLHIHQNPSLTSLTGLEQLSAVEGNLEITLNVSLTSLMGLQGISSVGGGLEIRFNGNLTSCSQGLSGLIDNGQFAGAGGTVLIGSNAPGCNSPQEVLATPYGADLNLATMSTTHSNVGDAVGYRLDVNNIGPMPASGTIVEVAIPMALPVIVYGTGCYLDRIEQQRQIVRCFAGTLAAGAATSYFYIYVSAAQAGTWPVSAHVWSSLNDPNSTNNTRTWETTIYSTAQAQQSPEDIAELEIAAESAALPETITLEGAYPNPFNPSTEIAFALPEATQVRLAVYDLLGREVAQLVNGTLEAGRHQARFEARDLPSGTYLYRLEAGTTAQVGRIVLMK